MRVMDGVSAKWFSPRRLIFDSSEKDLWSSSVEMSTLDTALSSRTVLTIVTKLVACTAMWLAKQDKTTVVVLIFGR